jgi:plasmid stabilization system protein ParE
MTRYTVVWVRSAQDELTEVWLSASDRQAVTLAAHLIETELAVDAARKGSELREGLRSFYVPPLKVIFAVYDDDRMVEVLRLRTS